MAYEDYLKKVADLAQQVSKGNTQALPSNIKTPGQIALFNNLKPSSPQVADSETPYDTDNPDQYLELVLILDQAVKRDRPDNWRGNPAKEQQIKATLYGILNNIAEVERIFPIIRQQSEY